jgi:hypothetical protein
LRANIYKNIFHESIKILFSFDQAYAQRPRV